MRRYPIQSLPAKKARPSLSLIIGLTYESNANRASSGYEEPRLPSIVNSVGNDSVVQLGLSRSRTTWPVGLEVCQLLDRYSLRAITGITRDGRPNCIARALHLGLPSCPRGSVARGKASAPLYRLRYLGKGDDLRASALERSSLRHGQIFSYVPAYRSTSLAGKRDLA